MKDGFYNGELGEGEEFDFQWEMRRLAADTSIPLRTRIESIFRETTRSYMLRLPEALGVLAAQVADAVIGLLPSHNLEIKQAICILCRAATTWTEEQTSLHIGINVMPYIEAALAAERRVA